MALAFALAVAGAGWFLSRRNAAAPPKAPVPAPSPALPREPAAARPVSPPLENVEVPPPVATPPARERTKTNHAVPESEPAPQPSSPPAANPAPASASAAERRPRAPSIPDGKTFVRTVNLPGEAAIELDGIVFSETNPVAVIGGHLLGPGSWIGDFEIVKIEENRVTLRGRGVTIFLTPS